MEPWRAGCRSSQRHERWQDDAPETQQRAPSVGRGETLPAPTAARDRLAGADLRGLPRVRPLETGQDPRSGARRETARCVTGPTTLAWWSPLASDSYKLLKNFNRAPRANDDNLRNRPRAAVASPPCSEIASAIVVARPSCRKAVAKRRPISGSVRNSDGRAWPRQMSARSAPISCSNKSV